MSDDFDRYTPYKYDRSNDGTSTYWYNQFKKAEAGCADRIREAEERVRRETREECAKVADRRSEYWRGHGLDGKCSYSLMEEAEDIAAAIRSLQPKEEGK